VSDKFQHKEGMGSLFKNDKKLTDKHPDYKGDAMKDGKEMWVSAWIKEGKKGKFMSLAFQDKEEAHSQGMAQARQAAAPPVDDFGDSEIPF